MNFRPNLNSMTTRLILLGLAILLFGSVIRALVLTDYLRQDLTDLTSAQLVTIANYVAKDIDRNIVARAVNFWNRLL